MPWNTVSGSRTTNGEGFFPSFYLSLVCFPKQFEKTTNRTHDIVECERITLGGSELENQQTWHILWHKISY